MVPCPSPAAASASLPAGRPSTLPHPDFATDGQAIPVTVKGVKLLKFSTAMSLADAVSFVTTDYPKSGWVIGDGDAEGHEADVPFSKGTVHGTLRLTGTEACTTTWLIATVARSGVDLSGIPQLKSHDDGDDDGGDDSGGDGN